MTWDELEGWWSDAGILKVCFTLRIWSPKPARINGSWNMQQKPGLTAESFRVGEIKDVVVRDLRKFNDRRGWLIERFATTSWRPNFSGDGLYLVNQSGRGARAA